MIPFLVCPLPPVIAGKTPDPTLALFLVLGVMTCAIALGNRYFRSELPAACRRGCAVCEDLIPVLGMTALCSGSVFVPPLMTDMRNRTAARLPGGSATLATLFTLILKSKTNDAKGVS
ncbi:hypothetical protein [Alistipes sp.]|uniref:hypothetical protein n=1 Tax=Alistipes sp. TaxID=1872444 RepID=UPI0025BD4F93|nr:hypothetical protein [Alistipes sp.]